MENIQTKPTEGTDIRSVTLDEVKTFKRDHPDGVIVDVLTREFHARQHIPGSVDACVFELAFPQRMAKAAPDKSALVLVYGAGDSKDVDVAVEKLRRDGYHNIRFFSGGLDAWKEARLPLEGSDTGTVPQETPSVPLYSSYSLVPGMSVIRWVGRNSAHNHRGTLLFSEGRLSFTEADAPTEAGAVKQGKGCLKVDMRSIDCEDLAGSSMLPVLIKHLESVDFFGVENYPEASLDIEALSPLPDGNVTRNTHRLRGRLTLLRAVQEVECDVAVRNLPEKELGLSCQFNLDRTRWGVRYGSAAFFRFLGMHSVDDNITLDVSLRFRAEDA